MSRAGSPTRGARRGSAIPRAAAPLLLLVGSAAACDGVTGAGGRLWVPRWSQAQDGATGSRPAVLGGVVFFGTGDGRVVARDRATGAARWSATIAPGGAVEAANLVVRSGVVVAAGVQHVVGLDAATGRELWRYVPPRDTVQQGPDAYPGQFVASHLDADDGAAYLPAWGASVSAVDLHSGAVRWVWEPGVSAGDTASFGRFRSGSMGVRASGDTVFATVWHFLDRQGLASEPWLVALDRATGRELWRVVLPSYTGGTCVWGAPGFFGNLVIVAAVGGRTWAVNRATQRIAWQFTPPAQFATLSEAEVAGDRVFVDGGDESIYALDAATGAVTWRAATMSATRDLLVTDRRVYYPRDGTLHALDRATGRQLATARVTPDGDIWETAAATDGRGRIFVTFTKGALSFDEP